MLNKLRQPFGSINWSVESIIREINSKTQQNKNYLRDNAPPLMDRLLDLIEANNWKGVRKVITSVEIKKINNWALWENFAQNLNKKMQSENFDNYDDGRFIEMLSTLILLNYEPHPENDDNLFREIQKRVDGNEKSLIQIGQSVIKCHPQLFKPYQSVLQRQILDILEDRNHGSHETSKLKYIIIEGLKVDFWESDFIEELKKYSREGQIDTKIKRSIDFCDFTHPNKEEKSGHSINSATETKIGDFIQDLGYQFNRSMLINHMEVDFLFPNHLILEYNGLIHYKINSEGKQPQLKIHDEWKNSIFRKRGYDVVTIPFYEWQRVENEKEQRFYLIQKIENLIVEKYFGRETMREVSEKIANDFRGEKGRGKNLHRK